MLRQPLISFAFVAVIGFTGCGGGDSATQKPATKTPVDVENVEKNGAGEEKKAPPAEKSNTEKSNSTKTASPGSETTSVSASPKPAVKAPAKKTGLSNLFKVPEIPQEMLVIEKPVEKPVETTHAKIQPKVRLLGFVKIDGVRKALIELGNNVHSVSPGDVIDGVEVIEIVNDQVTFQFVSARWTTPLFKQDWLHEQTGGGTIAARGSSHPTSRGAAFNRSFSASNKPASSKTPKSPFSSTRPANNQTQSTNYNNDYQATGGNIPGIPGVSSSGSIPGMPAAASSSSGSPSNSSPASAPGGMPGAPGATPSSAPGSTPGGTPGSMPGGLPGAMPGATPGGVPGGTPGGLPTGT